jgi:hypothetical protein
MARIGASDPVEPLERAIREGITPVHVEGGPVAITDPWGLADGAWDPAAAAEFDRARQCKCTTLNGEPIVFVGEIQRPEEVRPIRMDELAHSLECAGCDQCAGTPAQELHGLSISLPALPQLVVNLSGDEDLEVDEDGDPAIRYGFDHLALAAIARMTPDDVDRIVARLCEETGYEIVESPKATPEELHRGEFRVTLAMTTPPPERIAQVMREYMSGLLKDLDQQPRFFVDGELSED